MAITRRQTIFTSSNDERLGTLSEEFHEATKLRPFHGNSVSKEDYALAELRAMTAAYKQYRTNPSFSLPEMTCTDEHKAFENVLRARRTRRMMHGGPLTLAQVSYILFYAYGVTGQIPAFGGGSQNLRAAPSAGALYPAELYMMVRNVDGLPQGMYHYNIITHSLEQLQVGDLTDQMFWACCEQEHVKECAVVVLMSAVFQRTTRKYGQRGYRYVFLDIGHLAQNLFLASTALDIALVPTCGFFDDELNSLLKIDGVDESAAYVMFLGPCSEPTIGAVTGAELRH